LLIGKDGENLLALSHIIKKIVSREEGEENSERFYIDIGDYQSKKIQRVKNISMTMANRAKSFRRNVEMEPMTAYERMIVHSTLLNDRSIKTESEGEGKFRRVVIKFIE
jgi:spoIIIJ-associated protein